MNNLHKGSSDKFPQGRVGICDATPTTLELLTKLDRLEEFKRSKQVCASFYVVSFLFAYPLALIIVFSIYPMIGVHAVLPIFILCAIVLCLFLRKRHSSQKEELVLQQQQREYLLTQIANYPSSSIVFTCISWLQKQHHLNEGTKTDVQEDVIEHILISIEKYLYLMDDTVKSDLMQNQEIQFHELLDYCSKHIMLKLEILNMLAKYGTHSSKRVVSRLQHLSKSSAETPEVRIAAQRSLEQMRLKQVNYQQNKVLLHPSASPSSSAMLLRPVSGATQTMPEADAQLLRPTLGQDDAPDV